MGFLFDVLTGPKVTLTLAASSVYVAVAATVFTHGLEVERVAEATTQELAALVDEHSIPAGKAYDEHLTPAQADRLVREFKGDPTDSRPVALFDAAEGGLYGCADHSGEGDWVCAPLVDPGRTPERVQGPGVYYGLN